MGLAESTNEYTRNKNTKHDLIIKKRLNEVKKTFGYLNCPECKKDMRWFYSKIDSNCASCYIKCECGVSVHLWKHGIFFKKWELFEAPKKEHFTIETWKGTIDLKNGE